MPKIVSSLRLLFVLILIVGLVEIQAPQPVRAAGPWYVTTTGDDNNDCLSPGTPCATINGAIGRASAGDTVKITTGTYTGTADDVVLILTDIVLSGGWNAAFTLQSGTSIIDGQTVRRGINVDGFYTVTIEHFTIKNGFSGGGGGGGIKNNAGTLTLSNIAISDSSAGDPCCSGGNGGGGIMNFGGTVILNNSTISGNSMLGGFYGSGILNYGSMTISNSTISNNTGHFGIANNSGTVTLQNSIVSNNITSGADLACSGNISSLGYNIISNTAGCNFTSSAGDLTGVDPLLGPLQDNGGSSFTHALLPGSPAIDAGNPAGCTDQNGNLLTTDQRGTVRPQGANCDIGAYEFSNFTTGPATSLAVLSGNGQSVSLNDAFPLPLRAVALDDQGNRVSGVSVDFTAPTSGPSGSFADTGTNSTTVTTDAGGTATSPVFTANDQAGIYTVTASAAGLGSVVFNLVQNDRPVNDNFADALEILSLPFSATTDVTAATLEPNELQACILKDRTIWYRFMPAETKKIRVNVMGGVTAGVNIYRALDSGISNIQFIGCAGSGSPTEFIAEAGQTYYLQAGTIFDDVGSLQFTLEELPSMAGRVTDAISGMPLAGNASPFVQVTLQRICGDGCLEFIGSQSPNSEGRFVFDNHFGSPLPAGTYHIEVSAQLYQTKQFGPFEFNGDSLDVGSLPIDPLPTIGVITGRLVDHATGEPVSPTFSPTVYLYRCRDGNCFDFVNWQIPDSQGRFSFENDFSGNPLRVGTYRVVASAIQYQEAQTEPFDVGEGLDRSLGDFRITSFPVRFSNIQTCADIPTSGGECAFSVRIWNGLADKLTGDTWSIVNGNLPDAFAGITDLQVKNPQQLNLDKGTSKVFYFRLDVSGNRSSDQSFLCTRVFVGQGNNSYFNTVGARDLFCFFRTPEGYALASRQEPNALPQAVVTEATGTEIEPNNTCQTAQDVGAVSLPYVLEGNLDSTTGPDIDFYRFSGAAGALITIDHEGQSTGKGTLVDPFLGFFDSNCNLITLNDDFNSLNSHLEVNIPADGVFILGATTCCDSDFVGGGNGSYQLTIATIPVIGSISGRITNAGSGAPLPGDMEPFAFVRLLQCDDFGCFDVNSQATDSEGRFRFESDTNGASLHPGNYLVVGSADQYQVRQTEQFTVGEAEDYDIGDIALLSFPVRFSDPQTCSIPTEGGMCEFSVKITNGLSTRISGRAWSMVSGSSIGTFADFTAFQIDPLRAVQLNPGRSTILRFRFRVRSTVADGANICALVYVGQNPNPFFNPLGLNLVFCMTKGSSGFTLMSPQQARVASQQMQIQEPAPPVVPAPKK